MSQRKLVVGKRYLFVNREDGVMLGTYAGKDRGVLVFKDAVAIHIDEPQEEAVMLEDLLAAEPWEQSLSLQFLDHDPASEWANREPAVIAPRLAVV